MDSNNGIDQDKSEGDNGILKENTIYDNSGQCSAPTCNSDLSQLKTAQTPDDNVNDGESLSEKHHSVSESVNVEQNNISCDGDLHMVENIEEHSKATIDDIQSPQKDHQDASPVSDNSDGSDREIALDPVSADDMIEETNQTVSTSAPEDNEMPSTDLSNSGDDIQVDANCPKPSDDREEISDGELDLQESSAETPTHHDVDNSITHSFEQTPLIPSENTSVELTESGILSSSVLSQKSISDLSPGAGEVKAGLASSNSSEGGDIIDLKVEDAALKSSGSSFDEEENKASKTSQEEDLEAVSDDELPSAPLQPQDMPTSMQVSSHLIEGGEQVSSSEDEGMVDSMPESSTLSSGQEPSNSLFRAGQGMSMDDPNLRSLDAEPISDEEEIGQDDPKSPTVEGGEAGEIKSPVIGSPISEQGDLMLGEVEPVSAEEESDDTDGEIPSGDENSKVDDKLNRNMDEFENIDSDEEIGMGETKRTEDGIRTMSLGGGVVEISGQDSKGEYIESISDEEDVPDENKMETTSTEKPGQSSASLSSTLTRDGEFEKRLNQSSFFEHQVELDYEEAEGDDVEQKPSDMHNEMADIEQKPETEKLHGVQEEGILNNQSAGSDKDEGELSDDDCEEGEIKEPGAKKPFIKPVCRFFQRGNCTWGISCRFIHPGVNDKGNYQMIEIPGFKPVGVHARLGGPPGQWQENQGPPEEEVEVLPPPPPVPDVPHTETAWERGLRIAKEQRKKASERREQEPDFEEKRLNLSVDEERELNKENERMPKIIQKDPYYDQQAYEVEEYYKVPQDPWHAGHYENIEVRYHREPTYSPPYRQKPPVIIPSRYNRHPSPPIDKFGRQRDERRDIGRPEPRPVNDYPSPAKPPDEWTDPWRRSKSPKQQQRKPRGHSRSKRSKRSLSDSSNSSRSGSRSSSGSSRSSRSGSGSSGSSSRSRSPPPVGHPGMGRMDRQDRYGEQPRSMVSVRGSGKYNYDNYRSSRGNRGFDQDRNQYNSRQGGFGGGRGRHFNSMGRGGMNNRGTWDHRGSTWDVRPPRHRSPTPDRPLPYVRPRRKSGSSRSSSSRSRSRSRSKYSDSSRSRSSSGSSRSSSSSSSSAGSADSEHLYRDLGSPSRNPRSLVSAAGKHKQKQRSDARKGRGGASTQTSQRHSHHHSQQPPPPSVDRIPHPRDPHPRDGHARDLKSSQIPLPPSGGRSDSKYASRNAPQAPVKAKDPLKVVGQKSNIKLTLLPKQQQSSLGERPNPLASPPRKRHLSERESSPPVKRLHLHVPQASAMRVAADKAAKIQMRSAEKSKSPPPGSAPPSNQARSKSGVSPQKQPSSKSRLSEASPTKPTLKNPSTGVSAAPTSSKMKKSMSSRREELLKQLKAVEDAIARKKSKLP